MQLSPSMNLTYAEDMQVCLSWQGNYIAITTEYWILLTFAEYIGLLDFFLFYSVIFFEMKNDCIMMWNKN